MPAPPVIAIDGPSASGKGTVAQRVAEALRFHYLNSGALYRTVALAAIKQGLEREDELTLSRIAMNLRAEFSGDHVLLDGHDVTDAIRAEELGTLASRIAEMQPVRRALLDRQRAFLQPPGLVADGRDMGTVVFPEAVLKIFLTATPEERARRRHKQLMGKGMSANMATLLEDIRARDARDSARAAAPLKKAADAIVIDTTGIPAAEAIAQVLALYKQAPRRHPPHPG